MSASTITVVLTGETGTGKEVLASAMHGLSRRQGPLVAVNCGTLTESLAESLLAGHTRGAFSGAISDAPGFVRSAAQGTLLLDEVQDSSRTAQGALLRVLQEREVTPIGGTRPQPIDVRFVATSPLPLETLVRDGRLRPDLCARLAGFTFVLTPLRERLEDVGVLVSALLRSMGVSERDRPRLAPELAFAFLTYHWPLNVRELEQTLRRGWLLAEDGMIELACFHASPAHRSDRGIEQPPTSREDPSSALVRSQPTAPQSRSLTPEEEALRRQVLDELRRARGNVAEVARTLGKAPMQVHRWMKRFRIDPSSFRGSARPHLAALDPKGLSSN